MQAELFQDTDHIMKLKIGQAVEAKWTDKKFYTATIQIVMSMEKLRYLLEQYRGHTSGAHRFVYKSRYK